MGKLLATTQRARSENAIRSERLALSPPCAQMKVVALLFTILAVATGFASPPSDDPPVPGRTTYSGSLVGHSGCMIPDAANYDATADVSDDGSCVFCNGGLFFTGTGSPLTAMTAPFAEGAATRGAPLTAMTAPRGRSVRANPTNRSRTYPSRPCARVGRKVDKHHAVSNDGY